MEVLHGPTVGFDLFAVDPQGKVFPKSRLVGISVKTRILKGNYGYSSTIPIDEDQVRQAARAWAAEPWLAAVVGSPGHTLEVMLVPYASCDRFKGRAKRSDVISVSAMENDRQNIVRMLFKESNPNSG